MVTGSRTRVNGPCAPASTRSRGSFSGSEAAHSSSKRGSGELSGIFMPMRTGGIAASRTNFSSVSCMAGGSGTMISVKAAEPRSSGSSSRGTVSSGGASSASTGVKRLRRRAAAKSRLTCCSAASCDPVPWPSAMKTSCSDAPANTSRRAGVRGASRKAPVMRPAVVPCHQARIPWSDQSGDHVEETERHVVAGERIQKKASASDGT